MNENSTLVAPLILPVTISVVPILYIVDVAKDRPRPLREAVDTAQTQATRWAIWFALALTVVYAMLDSLDRWGAWVLAGLLAGTLVAFGIALPVVRIWKKRRREAAMSGLDLPTPRGPATEVPR